MLIFFIIMTFLLRFRVYLPDGYFWTGHNRPTGWTHIVLNYIGPQISEGIRIYVNGTEVKSDTTKTSGSLRAGDGRIVVGRHYTDRDGYYASVQVDELIYFDAALTTDNILSIYNSA